MGKIIFKSLWLIYALSTLIIIILTYDGKPTSDSWILLTYLMLNISFPAGLIVSAGYYVLHHIFFITFSTTYFSLSVEWLIYSTIGYWQWFKFVPYIYSKFIKSK